RILRSLAMAASASALLATRYKASPRSANRRAVASAIAEVAPRINTFLIGCGQLVCGSNRPIQPGGAVRRLACGSLPQLAGCITRRQNEEEQRRSMKRANSLQRGYPLRNRSAGMRPSFAG